MLLHVNPSKSFSVARQYPRSVLQVLNSGNSYNNHNWSNHIIRPQRHPTLSSWTSRKGVANTGNADEFSNSNTPHRLEDLYLEITKLNGGIPMNINSPKQISQAIFGTPTLSTSKLVLQQVVVTGTCDNNGLIVVDQERRRLAALILEYRTLVSKQSKAPPQQPPSPRRRRRQGPLQPRQQQASFSTLADPIGENDDALDETTDHILLDATLSHNISSTFSTKQRESPSSNTYETLVDNLFSSKSKIDPYWKDVLLQVSKPSARALLSQLNPTCPMGYDPTAHPHHVLWRDDSTGGEATSTTAGKKGTFLAYCRDQKIKYGDCITLTRCGDFYETFGIDAIMLVEVSFGFLE
jgi:hypothetical protein